MGRNGGGTGNWRGKPVPPPPPETTRGENGENGELKKGERNDRGKGRAARTQADERVDEAVGDALAEEEHAVAHLQERAQRAQVVDQVRCTHTQWSARVHIGVAQRAVRSVISYKLNNV